MHCVLSVAPCFVAYARTVDSQERVLREASGAGGPAEAKLCDVPKVKLALPRGRFDLELYPRHAKLCGAQHPYRIPYESVARMYHLPHPRGEGAGVFFILSLDPPLRRGQVCVKEFVCIHLFGVLLRRAM